MLGLVYEPCGIQEHFVQLTTSVASHTACWYNMAVKWDSSYCNYCLPLSGVAVHVRTNQTVQLFVSKLTSLHLLQRIHAVQLICCSDYWLVLANEACTWVHCLYH